MIPIVKPYLPALGKYQTYLEGIYQRNWLTNNGPLLQELEQRLMAYLGVENLMLVANGTLALQVAYRALGLQNGSVITTPFTFAASPGSLNWQNLQPVFSDIDKSSLNIDASLLVDNLTKDTKTILGVHVFGNPCEIEKIDNIAKSHSLKVIYDAAHTFGAQYKGKSLLGYGDAATISLHATKIFHCVEGGAIVFKHKADMDKAKQLINFGFDKQNMPEYAGINAKMSEFHAAMGLAVLDEIEPILADRKETVSIYHSNLKDWVDTQSWHTESVNNGAYAPILLKDEAQLLSVQKALTNNDIQSRRYFYPSLSNVAAYGETTDTPVSNDASQRVLCLPLYCGITMSERQKVIDTVKSALVAR